MSGSVFFVSGSVFLVSGSVFLVSGCVFSVRECVFSVRKCVSGWYGVFVWRELSEMWILNKSTRFFTAPFVLYWFLSRTYTQPMHL